MNHSLFAYFGPEVTMPVASILGAIFSVGVMFGRRIVSVASRLIRVTLRNPS